MNKKYPWIEKIVFFLEDYFQNEKKVSFYGRKKIFKNSYKWRALIYNKIVVSAPEDSVIHIRYDKEGVILTSESAGVVLKIFTNSFNSSKLNREITILKDTSKEYLPRYFSHGEKDGLHWLVVEYKKSLETLNIENMFFEKHVKVMKSLGDFYQTKGFEKITIADWLDSISLDYRNHSLCNDFDRVRSSLLKEASSFNFKLVRSTIHGDIHVQNLIWTQEPILIDWEGSNPNELVLIDYFDPLKRYLQTNKKISKKFQKFLSEKDSSINKELEPFFQNFRRWYKSYFNEDLPKDSDRIIFMIYALDRAVSCVRGYESYSKHAYEFELCLAIS